MTLIPDLFPEYRKIQSTFPFAHNMAPCGQKLGYFKFFRWVQSTKPALIMLELRCAAADVSEKGDPRQETTQTKGFSFF